MKKTEKFLQLIAEAIAVAEKYEKAESTPEWQKNDCKIFLQNLKKLGEDVQSGTDIRSVGAGLGITRFLSENEAPDVLYSAGRAVEVFFKEQLK